MFAKLLQTILKMNIALADNTGTQTTLTNPLGTANITDILERVFGWLLAVSVPIVAIIIVVGGYQIMFAGGNPERVSNGKKTITYAVAGLTVVLLSWSAIALLKWILQVT